VNTAGDWHGAVTFGLSVAVALTPQMLPMIVTANLVQGVRQLRKQNAVVKRLDAVQNLGAMYALCAAYPLLMWLLKGIVLLGNTVHSLFYSCRLCFSIDPQSCCTDVLCTDKTGTLTSEQTTLALEGNQDYTSHNVLKLAYANSYFQVCKNFIVTRLPTLCYETDRVCTLS